MGNLFEITNPAQLSGEQVVVDDSAKMRAQAMSTLVGGLGEQGKKIYEGQVLAEMEGVANSESEVADLTIDEVEGITGFSKLRLAYEQNPQNKKNIQLLAATKKNEAIASAPWMRERINQRYSQWFGGSSSGKGGVFSADEKSPAQLLQESQVKAFIEDATAGAVYLPEGADDEYIMQASVKRSMDIYKKNQIAASDVKNTVNLMGQAQVIFANEGINGILAIINNPRLSPQQKKNEVERRKAGIFAEYKQTLKYAQQSSDIRTAMDKSLSDIGKTIDNLSTDDALTGGLSTKQISNNLTRTKDLLETSLYNDYPTLGAAIIVGKNSPDVLQNLIMGNKTSLIALRQQADAFLKSSSPGDVKALGSIAITSVLSPEKSKSLAGITTLGEMTKEQQDATIAELSPDDRKLFVQKMENLLRGDVRSSLVSDLNNKEIPRELMNNFTVTFKDGKYSLVKRPDVQMTYEEIVSTSPIVKNYSNVIQGLSSAVQGLSVEDTSAFLSQSLGLGSFQREKSTSEVAGEVASSVISTVAGAGQETKQAIMPDANASVKFLSGLSEGGNNSKLVEDMIDFFKAQFVEDNKPNDKELPNAE